MQELFDFFVHLGVTRYSSQPLLHGTQLRQAHVFLFEAKNRLSVFLFETKNFCPVVHGLSFT